jgi:hypothetical protein
VANTRDVLVIYEYFEQFDFKIYSAIEFNFNRSRPGHHGLRRSSSGGPHLERLVHGVEVRAGLRAATFIADLHYLTPPRGLLYPVFGQRERLFLTADVSAIECDQHN